MWGWGARGEQASEALDAASRPLVSVILTTRDRPRFLALALRSFAAQTYANRELIVVDDGLEFPVDEAAVRAAGGRLLRVEQGASIGAKLNAGIAQARGTLCQKMDDDDWYAPRFLESMVATRRAAQTEFCAPLVSFVQPFLFFELARWEIRRSVEFNVPGATLLFEREDWAERPFRDLGQDEDVWFFQDQLRLGRAPNANKEAEVYLAVRHHGLSGDRSHTWTHQRGQQTLEQYLQSRPLYDKQPEDLLPPWALHAYRALRAEMLLAEPDGDERS